MPTGWRKLQGIHLNEGHWQGKTPERGSKREKRRKHETTVQGTVIKLRALHLKYVSRRWMCHLLDSLWQQATVWFVSQVLLISFSYQQSHFTVKRWRQGQGAILQERTGWATNSQDFWAWHLHCFRDHLCVTPVQPLQYDAGQPVLHCWQRMLEQPGSNHTNLLGPWLPQT